MSASLGSQVKCRPVRMARLLWVSFSCPKSRTFSSWIFVAVTQYLAFLAESIHAGTTISLAQKVKSHLPGIERFNASILLVNRPLGFRAAEAVDLN